METIAALVLAAGGSSRLGQPKQFLFHQGRTLIEHAVDAVVHCDPVVVVAGRDAQRIEELLRVHPVCVVRHVEWARGIGSSIRIGVRRVMEISPNADAVVILLCDQPHVTEALVGELQAKWVSEQKPIVACHYAGGLGVPALFSRSVFPELLSLDDHTGAKRLLGNADGVSVVTFPKGAVDIDTPVDVDSHLEAEVSR